MTEESKEKQEKPEKDLRDIDIETGLDRIAIGEKELIGTNEPTGYAISLADTTQWLIAMIQDDAVRTEMATKFNAIMTDAKNEGSWYNRYHKITDLNKTWDAKGAQLICEKRADESKIGSLGELRVNAIAQLIKEGTIKIRKETGLEVYEKLYGPPKVEIDRMPKVRIER